ncbi:hypothetical protein N7448_010914 [Penicillium atrosanguineum]|uniref:Uncharacterized protein n=1 Tax=Penicillium atrosanguineum TaxID=1132637 RepID=A0A9W9U0N4_9EURO|nr:uncharacterized protein N7443_008135 [Penicillium atrosanguineum]KAJ5119208.1 hypothetical protein N7526_010845 [Penicillium atrosanguineum]KAJ5120245.1 hypothetical protein N7448_010914 [Penicillium atrosanguineum]KAJ5297242.1 hypothetical protein N7443_008135 [Penicillium atrosanguineum]KAJ5300004.1 hypothetical protein N7476_011561 [Penicillium atrosanguineum]
MMERRASSSERTPLIVPTDPGPKTSAALATGLNDVELIGLLIATNMSMMTTAQSYIAADLDAFAEATWFTSAYMIAMSSVTPLSGRLSGIFTPRLYVIFSGFFLAAGLFITAAAPTLAVFLLGRVVTGVGSGGLMSSAIILVLDLASPKRRGLFIGLINAGYTTGVASGAVLAGLLTPIVGWRLLFWIQAPAALVLGPLLFLALPTSSNDRGALTGSALRASLARVDYAGSLTLTLSVVLMLSSLASPQIPLWPIPLSLFMFGSFILIESKWTTEPVIPVRLLRNRSVLMTCIAALGMMMARWAVLFFTPAYAIAVRGWSPASAGLLLVPTNAGFGTGGLLVGWLHIRKANSYYISCLIIFFLFAMATAALAFLSTPTSSAVLYMFVTFLDGLFAGSLMNYTLSHVLHMTNPESHYIVTSLVAMSRGFAGSFGSAIGGGFFARVLKGSLETGFSQHGLSPRPELVRTLLGSPATVLNLSGLERLVAIQSYEYATRMLFLAGSALALAATVFQAGTGWRARADDKRQDSNASDEES